MKTILYLAFALTLLLASGCCSLKNNSPFSIFYSPENDYLEDCSSIIKLKQSIFNYFEECNEEYNKEHGINVSSYIWGINDNEMTYEVCFRFQGVYGEDNSGLISEPVYIVVSKKNCQIIEYKMNNCSVYDFDI